MKMPHRDRISVLHHRLAGWLAGMRRLALCAGLSALTGLSSTPAIAQDASEPGSYPFQVVTEKDSVGHRLIARNQGPSPISIRVSLLDASNAFTDPMLPVFAVIPPYGTQMLARVKAADSHQRLSFRFQNAWLMGDFRASHQPNTLYRLPYREGQAFRISQAEGGVITTHTRPDSRYAVDFSMPERTPIVAAREGIVVKSVGTQVAGGQDPSLLSKANVIRILHGDNTIATYAHLAYGGTFVYPGQRVVAGQEIGLSGSTGYSSGPHLHFAVTRLERVGDSFQSVSIPIQFYSGNPASVFTARQGMSVRAEYPARINPSGSGYYKTGY